MDRDPSHAVCGTLIAVVVAAPLPLALSSRPAHAQEASPVRPSSLGDGHVTCRAPGTGNEVRLAIGSRRLLGRVVAKDGGVAELETIDGRKSVRMSEVDTVWIRDLAVRRGAGIGAAVGAAATAVALSASSYDPSGLLEVGAVVGAGAAAGGLMGMIAGNLVQGSDRFRRACPDSKSRGDAAGGDSPTSDRVAATPLLPDR